METHVTDYKVFMVGVEEEELNSVKTEQFGRDIFSSKLYFFINKF